MHLYRNLYPKITDMNNILEAYDKASRLKHQRKDFKNYEENLMINLFDLQQRLLSGTYKVGKYSVFKVYEDKERLIMKLPPKDRVAQHAWNNICNPLFEPKFIYDSYACRPDKGLQVAVQRMKNWLHKLYIINNEPIYSINGDIHHYFQSIDHQVLFREIEKVIGCNNTLWLTAEFINSNNNIGPGVGVPIGNLTSQLFANIYGNILDQYVKRELKCTYYMRYMDDFRILDNDYHRITEVYKRIEYFINNTMKMQLNSKTNITYINNEYPMNFIGFRIYPNRIIPRKKTVQRLYDFVYSYEEGYIDLDTLCKSWPSMTGYIEFSDSTKLINDLYSKIHEKLYDLYLNSDMSYSFNFGLEQYLGNYYNTIMKDKIYPEDI